MKFIRRIETQPEPMPGPAEIPKPEPQDAGAMLAAVVALRDAAERIRQAPKVEVTVPAAEKPKAFTVTITKRDAKGRAVEFDIRVKDEDAEETDPFVHGYNGVKQ